MKFSRFIGQFDRILIFTNFPVAFASKTSFGQILLNFSEFYENRRDHLHLIFFFRQILKPWLRRNETMPTTKDQITQLSM
jgi:hypothetical protein